MNNPRVISIASGKGGVGKTFISVNTAIYAAKKGIKTLLIDADLGLANVNIMLGINPNGTIMDVLNGNSSLSDITTKHRENLDIICGGSGFSNLSNITGEEKRIVSNELKSFSSNYDLIIIDVGAGIGGNAIYFTENSEDIFVILTPDPTSLTDSYAFIKILSKEKNISRFNIIVNQACHKESSLTFERLLNVSKRYLDVNLIKIGDIDNNKEVEVAIRSQKDIFSSIPNSSFCKEMESLGSKIINSKRSGTKSIFNNSPIIEEI